jgi:hypothetical protein
MWGKSGQKLRSADGGRAGEMRIFRRAALGRSKM